MAYEQTKEFYDNLYTKQSDVFGNGNPSPDLKFLLDNLKAGSVMELGAGEGRNAVFLAKKGFKVTAIELSEAGSSKIIQAAKTQNLDIEVITADVASYEFTQNYDAFVMTYVLQHLTPEDANALVEKMKSHTSAGGLNIIEAFINEGDMKDFYPRQFFPDSGALKNLYADWEVLLYKEEQAKPRPRPDGTKVNAFKATIVAKK